MCVNAPEYLEAFFAAQKLGAVPVNVNYRYVGAELAYLLDNSDTRRARVPRRVRARPLPTRSRRSRRSPAASAAPGRRRGGELLRSTRLREHLAAAPPRAPTDREPSGDDLVFVYTGGTTGSPKAVMWRSDDLYVSLWQMARPGTQPPDVETAMRADKRGDVPARVPAHARHRSLHRVVDARRRRNRRAPRHAAPRCRRGVGRGGARARAGVHDRRRRVRAPVARRARRRAAPLGSQRSARDHVVGRHVEPADQARPARAPAARDPDRLARRVGRNHDAHRDARRRRDRTGAIQGERTRGRGDRRGRARAARATT